MIPIDIIGLEKEEDPPAGLVADPGALPFPYRAGEQEARTLPSGRRHHHPALFPLHWTILEQLEAELFPKEADRLVIVGDQESDRG
jgi:hypothetical protein